MFDRARFDALLCRVEDSISRRATLGALGATLLGIGGVRHVSADRPRRICCEYRCQDGSIFHKCLKNKSGNARCSSSADSPSTGFTCSFNDADRVKRCRKCPNP